MNRPTQLAIGRELEVIAASGLDTSRDVYDRQRFERIREMAALLVAAEPLQLGSPPLQGVTLATVHATPKVDVRAAAVVDSRILLVREVSDGLWTLPGGWADVNQSPADCVIREVLEESGFIVKAVKLAAVYDYQTRNAPRQRDSIYKLFFLCDVVGGAAKPSEETSEVGFFSRLELPPLSLGRSTPEQIETMFQHHENSRLATEFD